MTSKENLSKKYALKPLENCFRAYSLLKGDIGISFPLPLYVEGLTGELISGLEGS